jgi:hypothetical protein
MLISIPLYRKLQESVFSKLQRELTGSDREDAALSKEIQVAYHALAYHSGLRATHYRG